MSIAIIILCAIKEEAEELATSASKSNGNQATKTDEKMIKQWKFKNAPDGKFEDFVFACKWPGKLIAAGSRADCHVPMLCLKIFRGRDDDCTLASRNAGTGFERRFSRPFKILWRGF